MSAPQQGQPSHRIEYPDPSTRYLLPPERSSGKTAEQTTLATRLEANRDGVSIDGQPVPWYLHNVALQVDVIDPSLYVVYLPVLINGEVVAGEGVRSALLGELLSTEAPPVYDEDPPTTTGYRYGYDGEDMPDDHADG